MERKKVLKGGDVLAVRIKNLIGNIKTLKIRRSLRTIAIGGKENDK